MSRTLSRIAIALGALLCVAMIAFVLWVQTTIPTERNPRVLGVGERSFSMIQAGVAPGCFPGTHPDEPMYEGALRYAYPLGPRSVNGVWETRTIPVHFPSSYNDSSFPASFNPNAPRDRAKPAESYLLRMGIDDGSPRSFRAVDPSDDRDENRRRLSFGMHVMGYGPSAHYPERELAFSANVYQTIRGTQLGRRITSNPSGVGYNEVDVSLLRTGKTIASLEHIDFVWRGQSYPSAAVESFVSNWGGDRPIFVQCTAAFASANPQCQLFAKFGDLSFSLSFDRADIENWKGMIQIADHFLGCMDYKGSIPN